MATKLNEVKNIGQKNRAAKLGYQFDALCGEVGIMHTTPRDIEQCTKHLRKALNQLVKAYDNCGGGQRGCYPVHTLRMKIVSLMETIEIIESR